MDYKSPRWKRLRERALARDKWRCRECARFGVMREASVVHHVRPVEDCPESQWDLSNLISLCSACHNAMHVRGGHALSERGRDWVRRNNPPPSQSPPEGFSRDRRGAFPSMSCRALAFMPPERRDRFLALPEVNDFAERFRAKFRGASQSQTRAVSGADLLIPDTVLEVLRENVSEHSKLYKFVRVASVSGTARQTIMGNIPEAVWTEMCASLNELFFTMGQVETDGYMVGGYVPICNAVLEDTNPVLLNEIITGLGRAIGKALDKAIIFGTGVKMPIGFVTRLAQSAKPADYPASGRPWEDLRTSNIITIPANVTGLALFQALIIASGSAKGSYSDGRRFWAMTDATYTKLVSEAMSINAAGAIATGMSRVMPIIGGDIVTMGDGGDILPDNVIVGGYGDEYLLAERAGTAIAYSDQPLFIQNQTVFKGVARYDGVPVIPEGFVIIGLGAAPATTTSFNPDIANTPDATLRALMIGNLALTPAFASATTSYTASTTNATDIIAFITAPGATAEMTVGGKAAQPGLPVEWASGENAVAIAVTSGSGNDKTTQTYTVTVTKS